MEVDVCLSRSISISSGTLCSTTGVFRWPNADNRRRNERHMGAFFLSYSTCNICGSVHYQNRSAYTSVKSKPTSSLSGAGRSPNVVVIVNGNFVATLRNSWPCATIFFALALIAFVSPVPFAPSSRVGVAAVDVQGEGKRPNYLHGPRAQPKVSLQVCSCRCCRGSAAMIARLLILDLARGRPQSSDVKKYPCRRMCVCFFCVC